MVRLHIIALSSVAMLTLGSHENQTPPCICPNLSHPHFPSPSLFHDELANVQFKVYCLQKQLEMIQTDVYYLQISMNTNSHYLNEKKNTQVAFSWVLVKLPPEYRRSAIRNTTPLWKHKDEIFLIWLLISNYCCHFIRPFSGQHRYIRKKILTVELTTIL